MTPEQLREAWDRFNATVRNKVAGEYGPFTNQHWADICAIWQAHADALEEVTRLKAAVELLYDKWENGDDCHEISGDEMGAFLGKAFQLSKDEEDAILALINGIPTPSPMQIVMQRAEQAERRAERLKFHAEAMARDLDDWSIYAGCPSNVAKAYRAEFKEE